MQSTGINSTSASDLCGRGRAFGSTDCLLCKKVFTRLIKDHSTFRYSAPSREIRIEMCVCILKQSSLTFFLPLVIYNAMHAVQPEHISKSRCLVWKFKFIHGFPFFMHYTRYIVLNSIYTLYIRCYIRPTVSHSRCSAFHVPSRGHINLERIVNRLPHIRLQANSTQRRMATKPLCWKCARIVCDW